jgi:dipeptidyl aminopeptidase/acylaminoacyl peptidase
VNALLDFVIAHYATDRKKVAVTGYSMGGTGSWHLAEIPGTLQRSDSNCQPAAGWRLPVLAIHSRDDQVAPFDPAAARIAELQKAGVNAKLIALTGISHYETFRFRDALRQAVPWLREVWK